MAMWYLAGLLVVVGCAVDVVDGAPSADPTQEIDGEYLDASRGGCFGGVGGQTRCSGNPCIGYGERQCGSATGCFLTYQDHQATVSGRQVFRGCLPVEALAPVGGDCSALGPDLCARREDCAAIYDGVGYFSSFVGCETDLFHLLRQD
jgi:hypothetical protein